MPLAFSVAEERQVSAMLERRELQLLLVIAGLLPASRCAAAAQAPRARARGPRAAVRAGGRAGRGAAAAPAWRRAAAASASVPDASAASSGCQASSCASSHASSASDVSVDSSKASSTSSRRPRPAARAEPAHRRAEPRPGAARGRRRRRRTKWRLAKTAPRRAGAAASRRRSDARNSCGSRSWKKNGYRLAVVRLARDRSTGTMLAPRASCGGRGSATDKPRAFVGGKAPAARRSPGARSPCRRRGSPLGALRRAALRRDRNDCDGPLERAASSPSRLRQAAVSASARGAPTATGRAIARGSRCRAPARRCSRSARSGRCSSHLRRQQSVSGPDAATVDGAAIEVQLQLRAARRLGHRRPQRVVRRVDSTGCLRPSCCTLRP